MISSERSLQVRIRSVTPAIRADYP